MKSKKINSIELIKIYFNEKEISFTCLVKDVINSESFLDDDKLFRDEMRLNLIHQLFSLKFCETYLK